MFRPWMSALFIVIFGLTIFYLYLIINVPEADNVLRIPEDMYKYRYRKNFKDQNYASNKLLSNSTVKDCSAIHVAMVCAGYNSTLPLVTTVKSVLFYRSKPIHFHFLVDEIALRTLNTLFDTWNLPQVVVSYYKTEDLVPKVSWIPNKHYSGVYGLLKLVLPDAIQESQIIVLDTDLTFQSDIYHLWQSFDKFNETVALGLVENQSNWYLKSSTFVSKPWPALGRGFNTGVMLMDLRKLRSKNFNFMWQRNTRLVLKNISETNLADQDIINAVIKMKPNIVFRINCTWNVQLSDHSLSEACYSKAEKINVIHWNSPRKLYVKHKHAEDFRKMYQIFLELDGNLLRSRLFGCYSFADVKLVGGQSSKLDNNKDPCSRFENQASIVYRTHPFFLEFEYNIESNIDVMLATQCSVDRIFLLEELSKHWPGVISIALYLTDAEVQSFLEFVHNSAELRSRKNIAYHVVYKDGEYYPVNYLRNVAMAYMKFPFVFQLDIDFLPQIGLHKTLLNYLNQHNLENFKKVAMVVPAFETQRYRFKFPSSKSELLKYLNRGILYTFRYHVWSQGHAPTNFSHYRNTSEVYEISWEPDFEPYVVVSGDAPNYDTRFVGFGWNKVSYITHLTALGYKYLVLPDTFVIHRPHTPSRDIGKFRTDALYRRCLKKLKNKFVDELVEKYKDGATQNLKKLFTKEHSTQTKDNKLP